MHFNGIYRVGWQRISIFWCPCLQQTCFSFSDVGSRFLLSSVLCSYTVEPFIVIWREESWGWGQKIILFGKSTAFCIWQSRCECYRNLITQKVQQNLWPGFHWHFGKINSTCLIWIKNPLLPVYKYCSNVSN